jgi:hypothetical protein
VTEEDKLEVGDIARGEMSSLTRELLTLVSEMARADIEPLKTTQCKIMTLVSTMAHDYARIVEMQSARLDALEAWKYGASEPQARERAN